MEAKIFYTEKEKHMRTILNKRNSAAKNLIPVAEEILPPGERQNAQSKPRTLAEVQPDVSAFGSTGNVAGSRGLFHTPETLGTAGAGKSASAGQSPVIPASGVTKSRGMAPHKSSALGAGVAGRGASAGQDTYLPDSAATGGRNGVTMPPRLRKFLQQGLPSLDSVIPDEYGSLAELVEQAAPEFSFEDWADKTTRQQQAAIQRSGLSAEDQMALLNAAPHYVETIAKVQELYANRTALGLTLYQFKELAEELFDITNARDEAINRTGKFKFDAGFAPKALRWLEEREDELLAGIGKNTKEDGQDTWYNDENSDAGLTNEGTDTPSNSQSEDYIQVPGQSLIGPNRNVPAVNCYGYILMYLGIEPSDGSYDVQPGQLSETIRGDHAYYENTSGRQNTDTAAIVEYFVRDIEQTGRNIRVINSYEDAIEEETVVALKNTKFFFGGDNYHFAIQLQNGSWADKLGPGNDSQQGAIENPDEPWGKWWMRYNSETIYFALSQP